MDAIVKIRLALKGNTYCWAMWNDVELIWYFIVFLSKMINQETHSKISCEYIYI